jgi:hypothetical protein
MGLEHLCICIQLYVCWAWAMPIWIMEKDQVSTPKMHARNQHSPRIARFLDKWVLELGSWIQLAWIL